jgi:hypothetical protein
MSKISNIDSAAEQEDDMLPEYDFSSGIRGKHRHRKMAPDLPGVQFLTNGKGQKTAVLLNLNIHDALWQDVSAPDPSEFQFLVTDQTRSVFLDFKQHLALWQTIYDRIIADLPHS